MRGSRLAATCAGVLAAAGLRQRRHAHADAGKTLRPVAAELAELAGADAVLEAARLAAEVDLPHDTGVRFLLSSRGDAAAASRRLREHAEWRSQTFPVPITDRDAACFCEGRDRDGRPVIVWYGPWHDPSDQGKLDALVSVLETALQSNSGPDGRVTLLVYCGERTALDVSFATATARLFKANYPERLAACCVFPSSQTAYLVFLALRPLIGQRTASKVHLVREPWQQELSNWIDQDNMPVLLRSRAAA
eukprot:TRINITY_DN1701_c12_g1_i1.p1 TRINITY_DN1701_c12_g1~~TRINITY_DN1701_c12_g1_i1.p1  ORF type:complete len:249 (+),score=31.10 TRINITY_DN1701_c12_g1_i1:59-805(+)